MMTIGSIPWDSCWWSRFLLVAAWLSGTLLLRADCTLTNTGITPLNELGFHSYSNASGGLYPNGANSRPPTHEAAGMLIAQQIQPLDGEGNVNTNQGRIVLLSLGMSNTTQEWASKGTANFRSLATNDPSLNPRVLIVDGAIGGQDAVDWTNANGQTWGMVITQRLAAAGVTTNQVQVLWLKQALAGPLYYGNFPLHAEALRGHLAIILRIAKTKYPNLRLVYLSCRTRAYVATPTALNPEPFAFQTAFADKWVIEDQILGRNNLNFDALRGPVVAPWISWGPYLWADGTVGRSDGFTWNCTDLESDFTHPSADGGVPKVARQLLAFFKTDPTTTPWFLRPSVIGQPPTCAPASNLTNGIMPLSVQFSANANDPDGNIRDFQWTFEDGTFSTNTNPTKIFRSPGLYHARLTVTDPQGNTARGSVTVNVTSTFDLWRMAKFTASELTNASVSGAAANPDSDSYPNRLEYAMGLEPKFSNRNDTVSAIVSNSVFMLSYPHFKAATDMALTVESSSDLSNWTQVPALPIMNHGPTETMVFTEAPLAGSVKFFRLKAAPL